MNTKRIRRSQVVIVVIALVALIMPTFAQSNPVRAQGKTLHYQYSEPAFLDPQASSFAPDLSLQQAIFRGLLRYDANSLPSPSIAKEVPTVDNGGISKDGKTVTFHLNTNYGWSDGKGVVTAQDFIYSWTRLTNSDYTYGYYFEDIIDGATDVFNKKKDAKLNLEAPDPATLVVHLVRPTPFFEAMVTLGVTYAVRKDNVERAKLATPDAWADPNNGEVVGDGPFKITKWDHNKEILLVKNTFFGGTAAKMDTIDLPLTDDAAVAYAQYQAGEIDIETAVLAAELDNIKADPTVSKQLTQYPLSCSFYLQMDNTKPPFNNLKVRQAFSYALNRDLYIKVITRNVDTKQLDFLPAGVFGHSEGLGSEYDYNPTKAKALLAEAGFPNGQGFPAVNFNYVAGANQQRRADWLQAQFQDILGVNITENPLDGATYEKLVSDPKVKISGLTGPGGWCSDYLHASDWLAPVFGTGSGNNVTGFSDPAFDKLAKAADTEPDQTKALAAYAAAEKKLIDDLPVAFMFNQLATNLIKPNVTGITTLSLDGGYPGSFFWENIDLK